MKNFYKKGVSLIAVLLFMLVATIAATATFKWLSSSGSSSGSRMMQKEAYQSAVAGLENARTWMTYHANDLGSIIRQYKQGDGGTVKPIKLNSQLKELTRDGQNYDVWLVGVNTEESTYKLKLLSMGKARNGSTYSEVGIFNVDGLYQVKKPQQNEESSGNLNFSYSYFGGSYSGAGNVVLEAGMVNGNWSGNPQQVDSNFVITGTMSLSGSGLKIKNGCIGGDYSIENGGLTADNVYFASNSTGRVSLNIKGNLYVDGNIDVNKDFTVDSSMTLNGKFDMHASDMSGNVSIGKDMCLGDNGVIDFTSNGNNHTFTVGRNVWVPGTAALKNGSNGTCNTTGCNILGKNTNALVYVQGATKSGDHYLQSGTAGYFKTNGTFYSSPSFDKPKCAQSIKEDCDKLWIKEEHCGTHYKIADPIVTAYDNFKNYAGKGCDLTTWGSNFADNASACYLANSSDAELAKTNLYNGYQVIHVTNAPDNSNCQSGKFVGKFIVIVDEQANCQNGAADVEDGSYVFLYLKKGASYFQGAVKNYFVYSLKEISDSQSLNLNGTIYFPSDSCVGISKAQSSTMKTNHELLKDLGDANILCDASVSSCGKKVEAEGEGSGVEYTSKLLYIQTDDYYVANAAQLSVTIESQYKSTENISETAGSSKDVEQDFIVLPRVIYMSSNPYGTLADYYNVLPLNGATIEKDASKVSCPALSGKTTGLLYDRNNSSAELLSEGIYSCTYTDQVNGAQKSVPFYIVVKGKNGNAPFVKFTEANVQMATSSNHTVKAAIPAHDAKFTLKVIKPDDMENWIFTVQNGSCATDNTCTFEIPANANASELNLFSVTTNNAGNGTAMFQLASGEGYAIGSPSTEVLYIASSVTVDRNEVLVEDLKKFCEGDKSSCPGDVSVWPDCSTDAEWVIASGANCGVGTTNTEWSCGVTSDISLSLTEAVPEGCVAITPEENVIKQSELVVGNTYYLAASLKAKPGIFKFGFSGSSAGLAGKTIVAKITNSTSTGRLSIEKECTFGSDVTTTASITEDVGYCELEIFRGETVTLSFPGDSRPKNFNYWKCMGPNCPSAAPVSGNSYTLPNITYEGNKVIAYFDETDKHCFFDEFKLSDASCSSNAKYCFGISGEKWYIADESELSKIDYENGYVAAKMNKSDKSGLTVMSTAIAGLSGTLKAQFQVPRVTTGTNIPTTVANSGFILRSNSKSGLDYLFMNMYANADGILTARLCNKAGSACKEKTFEGAHIDSRNTMVTLTALIDEENISLIAYIGSFSTTEYTASFSYADDGFSAYSNNGEYVGFRLADPNFKLFDIGWKSDDYGSECWDTYPTINCSFKAAYAGGIVPKNEVSTPWVGLSSWFDANGCTPIYYYNGTDAGCGSGSGYIECADGYTFTTGGIHGNVEDGAEVNTAKTGVHNCGNLDNAYEDLLAKTELAHCGTFWVGEVTECKTGITYTENGTYNGAKFFKSGNDVENLRSTSIRIELENDDEAQIEIYLVSRLGSEDYFSKSYETSQKGVVTFEVESILDADGFDPQQVTGIAIVAPSSVTISKVYTVCPNEVSLTCGNLAYNGTLEAWQFSVDITNYSKLSTLNAWKLQGASASASGTSDYNCAGNGTGDGQCTPIPKTDGKTATYRFQVDDAPYTSPDTYKFAVRLTTADSTYDCTTSPQTISSIVSTCSIEGTTEVYEGAGIPQFTYSVSNCPSSGCSYKVDIVTNSGSDVTNISSEENVATPGGSTTGNEANVGSALAAGTYKFRLKSTDDNLPFADCEKEFTVKETPKANCTEASISDGKFIATLDWSNWSGSLIFTDYLGHPMEGIPVNGTSTNFSYDIPEDLLTCSTGTCNYQATLQPAGKKCAATWTVVEQLSLSGCPETVEGTSVTFTPTVTGCGAEDCEWSINNGATVSPASSASNTGDVSITNATAGQSYTLTLTRGSNTKTCSIAFVEPPVCQIETYCSGFSAVELGDGNEHEYNSREEHCVFFTKASFLNFGNSSDSYLYINGKKIQNNLQQVCNSASGCATWLSGGLADMGVSPVDGGYYVYLPSHTYFKVKITGRDPCLPKVPISLSCPNDITGVETGSTVKVTPRSLSGCNSDCEVELIENSTAKTPSPSSNYNGGEISFRGASNAGETSYTLKVTNASGVSADCPFKVTYVAATSCHCETYCSASQCANLVTAGKTKGSKFDGRCYFATSIENLNGRWDQYYYVNGVPQHNGYNKDGVEKIDGGYYINTDHEFETYNFEFTLGTPNPVCSTGGSGGGQSTSSTSTTSSSSAAASSASGGGGGGGGSSVDLSSVYDGTTNIGSGNITVTCHTGVCSTSTYDFYCCPSNDCYNGSVGSLKINSSSATTKPRLDASLASCSNGGTISVETTDALNCYVKCHYE